MISFNPSNPVMMFLTILTFLVIIGVVISVHEASHAYFANLFGDPTARLAGRMSLNPIAHVDPFGTVLLPLVLIILGLPIFGWAKPTPVNPLNFRRPVRDSAIVAFAGPASNFLLAVFLAILFRIIGASLLINIIQLNLILGIFNLIPVPPLDGYKVLLGFLPREIALRLTTLELYSPIFLIIFLLLFFQIFAPYLISVLNFLTSILTGTAI
jgi:Zn-dependent protease